MATSFDDLLDDILATCRQDHDHYDLSVNPLDRVQCGDGGITMGEPPFVLFSGPRAPVSLGGVASLTEYQNAYYMDVWCWAPADSERAEDRIRAAVRLASDITKALESAANEASTAATYPALFGAVTVIPSLIDTFGDGKDLPAGCGVAKLELVIVIAAVEGL